MKVLKKTRQIRTDIVNRIITWSENQLFSYIVLEIYSGGFRKRVTSSKAGKTNGRTRQFFREGTLNFSFELIDENVLDEELSEKFEEIVEEIWKITSIMLAITPFFVLML